MVDATFAGAATRHSSQQLALVALKHEKQHMRGSAATAAVTLNCVVVTTNAEAHACAAAVCAQLGEPLGRGA